MLMYNKNMGIVLEQEQKGFTIIEVMLFLALSGFLMVGILAGTGSSIANQRYNDAVQDAVDALRGAYSFVADTQVAERDGGEGACKGLDKDDDNQFRGRTGCAVYGAMVTIDGARMQISTVIGYDYRDFLRAAEEAANNKNKNKNNDLPEGYSDVISPASDKDLLKALNVNNIVCQGADKCSVTEGLKERTLKWDTIFKAPRVGEETKTKDLKLALLIYRHPINGSIRTLSYSYTNTEGVVDYSTANNLSENSGIKSILEKMEQKDVALCVDSNGAESYANHRRIIKIAKNTHSQRGVILTNMDEDVYINGEEVAICDDQE